MRIFISNSPRLDESTPENQRIPSLDGWRAIAILGVLACHGLGTFFSESDLPSGIIYRILARGYIGVDIFFAISGFLICSQLLSHEETHGKLNFRQFYIRRAFRILPPLFAYLGVLAILKLLGLIEIRGHSLLSSVLLIQNYSLPTHEVHWLIGHLWTLAVEGHFYLIFPGILALLGKSNQTRAYSLSLWALGTALWRSMDFKYQFSRPLLSGVGFYTRTDICIDHLIFGAALAVIWKMPGFLNRTKTIIKSPFAFLALLCTYLSVLAFDPHFTLLWQALLIPLILVSTIDGRIPLISSLLECAPLRWVGRISYSLYLWNNILLVPVDLKPLSLFASFQKPPYCYPILITIACLSYYGLERPMIKLGHRLG